MANCPEKNFKNAQEMLLHLGSCNYYSERLFRYPALNVTGKSRTTPRKNPLDMLKLSQKLQEKLSDFIKSLKSARPTPKESPTPEPHGQVDIQLSEHELLASQGCPELPAGQGSLHELQGGTFSNQQNIPQTEFYIGELYGSNLPHLLDQPAELPSTMGSFPSTYSTGISPASSVESPGITSMGQMQYDGLRSGPNQDLEWFWDDNHEKEDGINWDSRLPTQPHDASSLVPMPLVLQSPSGQHSGPGHSLTIQTNLESNTDTQASPWESANSSGSSWLDTTYDNEESPAGGSYSLSASSMNTSPFSNTETSISSPETTKRDVGFNQPPDSGLSSPELQPPCPHCTYKPRGKKENFNNYIRKHMLKHEDDREKVKCKYCGKEFTRRDNCGVHMRKAHSISCDHKRRQDSPGNLENKKRTKSVSQ
ncbi:hypothetical protein F4776DRAFT_619849 [Hypoxylon sp. NC0597]|nr:hypothetical protein F4776DRAFT_619849 [Hypoxylon sp. NC0597]